MNRSINHVWSVGLVALVACSPAGELKIGGDTSTGLPSAGVVPGPPTGSGTGTGTGTGTGSAGTGSGTGTGTGKVGTGTGTGSGTGGTGTGGGTGSGTGTGTGSGSGTGTGAATGTGTGAGTGTGTGASTGTGTGTGTGGTTACVGTGTVTSNFSGANIRFNGPGGPAGYWVNGIGTICSWSCTGTSGAIALSFADFNNCNSAAMTLPIDVSQHPDTMICARFGAAAVGDTGTCTVVTSGGDLVANWERL